MTLQLNGTDGVTFNDGSEQWAAASPIGTKNLIINGDMRIAQRGTSATNKTAQGYYTVDRFQIINNTSTGAIDMTQSTTVPSGQGFANSIQIDTATAKATLTGTNEFGIQQRIEGQNLQHLKYGTSSAEKLTMSFWVKSNKTGTYVIWFYRTGTTRHIQKQYTINSADTWEKKTLTIDGDTTGAIANDNSNEFEFLFCLGTGPDRSSGTAPTTWQTIVNADRYVGQTVNILDSTSNYFNLTGVQLEVGDTATPFEVMPYDMQLARCQRYYNRIYDIWGDQSVHTVNCRLMTRVDYPVQMRANPTVTTNTVSNTSCTFQGSNRTNTNGTHLYANSTTATGDAFFVINNMESNAEL